MTSKQFLTGLGAFATGSVAMLAAAVLGEAYARNRPAPDPEPAPAEPVALIEAPHVAEMRDAAPAAAPAPASPEHVPTDLMADADPARQGRAVDAFRPDPTAPVPPELRESLRPATGPARGFAANEGDTVTEPVAS